MVKGGADTVLPFKNGELKVVTVKSPNLIAGSAGKNSTLDIKSVVDVYQDLTINNFYIQTVDLQTLSDGFPCVKFTSYNANTGILTIYSKNLNNSWVYIKIVYITA